MTIVSQTADRSDARLVVLARGGDMEAWGALVDRYSPYVHAIAVRGFGLQERDADDVFQEVSRRLYSDLGACRGELRVLVGRAARSLCLDRCSTEVEPARAVVLLQIEAAIDVHEALGMVDDPGRELLRRFFVHNDTYRAIANDLDLPVTAIPGEVANALDDLCDLLAAESE